MHVLDPRRSFLTLISATEFSSRKTTSHTNESMHPRSWPTQNSACRQVLQEERGIHTVHRLLKVSTTTTAKTYHGLVLTVLRPREPGKVVNASAPLSSARTKATPANLFLRVGMVIATFLLRKARLKVLGDTRTQVWGTFSLSLPFESRVAPTADPTQHHWHYGRTPPQGSRT